MTLIMDEPEILLQVALHENKIAVFAERSRNEPKFHLGSYAGMIIALVASVADAFNVSDEEVWATIAENAGIDIRAHLQKFQ